jgi:hypothetical protein
MGFLRTAASHTDFKIWSIPALFGAGTSAWSPKELRTRLEMSSAQKPCAQIELEPGGRLHHEAHQAQKDRYTC